MVQPAGAGAEEVTSMDLDGSSLVAAYGFDEGEGNEATDESGLGHTGEIDGATWGEPARGDGHSLYFDGEEGCLTVHESTGIELQHGFTVDAWIRPEALWVTESNEEMTIFEVPASETSPAVALVLSRTTQGILEAVIGEETVGQFSVASDPEEVEWGRWQYVAMTYDGTDLKLYVGGELVGQATVNLPAAAAGPMTVGCSRTTPNTFRRGIDELRVYTRALTSEELAADETTQVKPVHIEVYGQLPNVPEGGFDGVQSGLYVRASAKGEAEIEGLELKVDGNPVSVTSREEALEAGGAEYCLGNVCYLGYEYKSGSIFPAGMASGRHTVSIVVRADHGEEATFEKTVMVDVDLPAIHLSGKLYKDAGQMTEDSEELDVSATDGGGTSAAGIENVTFYVDGEWAGNKSSPCEGGCGGTLEASYAYSLEEWGGNPHLLTVAAADAAGNVTTKTLTVQHPVHPNCGSVECTNIWTGPKKGDWGTAKWWSAEHVPTSSDIVYIEAGKTVEVSEASSAASVHGEGTLPVAAGGSLALSDPSETSTVGHLEIEEGSLTDKGSLTVLDSLGLADESRLRDNGVARLSSGATGVVGSVAFEGGGTFVNEGTMTIEGKREFLLQEGARFRNEGTLKSGEYSGFQLSEGSEIKNNGLYIGGALAWIEPKGATPKNAVSFVNNGTFKSDGTPILSTVIAVPFENTGAIEAGTGIVQFERTTAVSSGGALSSEEGGLIRSFGGVIEVEGGSITGKLSQWGGRERLDGGVNASNLTLWANGPSDLGTATLEFDQTDLPARRLELDENVTLTGSADVNVSEILFWSGGDNLAGTGKLVCESGALGLIEGAVELEQTFVNEGTVRLERGSLDLKGAAILENAGTFVANSEEDEAIKNSAASVERKFAMPEGGDQLEDAGAAEGLAEAEATGTSAVEAEGPEHLSGRSAGPALSLGAGGGHPIPALTYEGGSGARFVNAGTLKKTAGSGTTTVAVPFTNDGTIRETSGRLNISSPRRLVYSAGTPHHSCSGDPVDCGTGNFTETQTDFQIGGRGVGLDLTRTYSAQAAVAGAAGIFGYGWTNSFGDTLTAEEAGARRTLTEASGDTVTFTKSGAAWTAPSWTADLLAGSTETGFTLTLRDQTKEKFDASGQLESVTDRDGSETALAYNGSGKLETITDPSGRKITLTYNAEGLVEKASDPMGHDVKYAYESKQLKSVTLPGEASPSWQFKYDASHRMTSLTDGRGGKTTNEYDASNRVISQTDSMERKMAWEYAAFHTKIMNKATGAVTDEWFNSNNQPMSITRGFGTAAATESFTYTAAGLLASKTDGNGDTTTYGYSPDGDRTSERDAEGAESKWTFDEAHQLLTATTPSGEKTTIVRDAAGNPETISRPAPGSETQTVAFGYGPHGEVKSMTDPFGHAWTYEYDGQGDRTAVIDPEGDKRTWAYDEDSMLISSVSPRGNEEGAEASKFTTTVERDAQGRPQEIVDPLGGTTKYAYDADGNVESVTDPNGRKTKFTYDADNELTKVEHADKAVEETGYDGAGAVTSQTDGNNDKTTYVRNILEQPIETIDPLERKTTRTFDAAGNLKTTKDPDGRTTTFSYDKADRLTGISYSDGITPSATFAYDKDGNLTDLVDGTGESTYEYDQLDRLTHSKDGNGETVAWTYNLGDEPVGLTYPNGKSISRAFDEAGRLESVTDWLGRTTSFAYNRDTAPTSTTFPVGTGDIDEYGYDRADRVASVTMKEGAETIASLAYGRDPAGQLESLISKGLPGAETEAFGYDENERLTNAGAAEFGYDGANNPTKAPGTTNAFDKASRLESATGATFTYDKEGERTKRTPSNGPATTYKYDQAGDLTVVERAEEGETPAISESFGYDGTGLMASRTVGLTTNHLVWDVTEAPEALLSDGESSYLYGPGGLAFEQISSEEVPTYLHHDQLGSTRLLTNGAGEAAATFSFGDFGGLSGKTGSATTTLGYAGQYTLGQSGLQYLRARYYDPATAQFLTLDPGVGATRAPYFYAGDNPANRRDRTGQAEEGIDGCLGCLPLLPTQEQGERALEGLGEIGNEVGDFFGGLFGGGSSSTPAPAVGLGTGLLPFGGIISKIEESLDEAEGESSDDVPCELNYEIGDRQQQRDKDRQQVDKERHSQGTDPRLPSWPPSGSRIAKVIAVIGRLLGQGHH